MDREAWKHKVRGVVEGQTRPQGSMQFLPYVAVLSTVCLRKCKEEACTAPFSKQRLRFSFASNRTHSLAQMTSGRRTFIGAQPRRISNKLTMTLYYLIYKLIFNVVVKITFSYVLWVGQKVHSGFCKKLVKSPNKLFDQPIHCKLKNFIKILKKEGNTL